jgi:two-component system, sensor histidine kinase
VSAGGDHGGAPVLVVNDADGARYVMTRMLRRSGFPVVTAATGAAALRRIASDRPRVVVLDVQLPDMSGLDVCRRIKADPATQHVKVLHTSAVYRAADSKVDSLESGGDAYLTQPFEQEELIATVRSLLRLTETEQALRDRADQLDEANRRTHEFLAMLAHELRNPLAAIVASLPLLERRAPADSLEGTARSVMRRQSAQLTRLVDDLLDVARVTQGKIELKLSTTNLTDVVKRVTENVRQSEMAPRRQRLDLILPACALLARVDEMRIEQVLANLLDNASKYTDPGGWICVELSYEAKGQGAGTAVVIVRDSGMGIARTALGSIFDLFSQADVPLARSRGGLGVGLTLVRRLVELHGGRIHAESDGPGRGSAFIVRLPLAEKPVPQPSGDRAPSTERREKKAWNILLVEDNLDAQAALTLLLEMWGHTVSLAQDGLTGIAVANRDRPDIAFVDLGLPGVDGFEVARRIRASPAGEEIMLVALTGYGSAADREKSAASGFDLHLVKPVEPERLRALLEEADPERLCEARAQRTASVVTSGPAR